MIRSLLFASFQAALLLGQGIVPPFDGYKVATPKFQGKPVPPRIESAEIRSLHSRILEAAAAGPNFAGHYTVAEWGCGAGCVSIAVVDAATGAVYRGPFRTLAWEMRKYEGKYSADDDKFQQLEYRLDSRLLVARGCPEEARCASYFWEWTGSKFNLVRAIPAAPLAASSGPEQLRSESVSSLAYKKKDGEETVEITNVAFELAGEGVPGRAPDSRLVLRTTTHSTQVVGDKGVESTVTLEAWPLAAGLREKPLYSVSLPAAGAQTVDGSLWLIDRATDPDVAWWSVYTLGTGRRLFDTYTELLKFSVSREMLKQRYVGLEVPPDDTADPRLKAPAVVAVLTYASAERVIREALVTCGRKEQAAQLRSYSDTSRALSLAGESGSQAIRLLFTANYPAPPDPVSISIPVLRDDLDLSRAAVPPGFHVAAWRR